MAILIKEKMYVEYKKNTEEIQLLYNKINKLEQTICHEINMRAVRPSENLNTKQCVDFIDSIAKDAEKVKESGRGLTWMLTPSPTACSPLDQYCQIIREKK